MSDLQQKQSIAEANLRRIQLQNAARAQKVSDLFWNDKQRLLYGDNAISVNEPETYANLIQTEDQMTLYDEQNERELLGVKLTKISSKQTAIIILNELNDEEVILLNSYFPDFLEQLKATFGKQPTNQKIIIDFIKNYLGKKVKQTQSYIEPKIIPNINIPLPENPKSKQLSMILIRAFSECPELKMYIPEKYRNKNISILTKPILIELCNCINSIDTDEFDDIIDRQRETNAENTERLRQEEEDRQEAAHQKQIDDKKREDAGNTIGRKMIDSRRERKNAKDKQDEKERQRQDNLKTKFDEDVEHRRQLEEHTLTDFKNIKGLMRKRKYIKDVTTSASYKKIIDVLPYYKNPKANVEELERALLIILEHEHPHPVLGHGLNNKLKHGRGLDDKPKKVDKYKVDTKLLNKNILCIKYNSTGNIKMKPIDINDDIKAVVMDIMTDKFNDRLYQKLAKEEQKIIQHFVQEIGLSEKIPLKNTELEKLYYDFTILRGERNAGNDSDIVKRDLRRLTLQLIQFGRIPSSIGRHLLFELSL